MCFFFLYVAIEYKLFLNSSTKNKWCPAYDIKLHLMTSSKVCEVLFYRYYSLVEPVRDLSIGWIDLFKNYSYLMVLCVKLKKKTI